MDDEAELTLSGLEKEHKQFDGMICTSTYYVKLDYGRILRSHFANHIKKPCTQLNPSVQLCKHPYSLCSSYCVLHYLMLLGHLCGWTTVHVPYVVLLQCGRPGSIIGPLTAS